MHLVLGFSWLVGCVCGYFFPFFFFEPIDFQAFKEMETDGIIVSGNDLVQICAADAVNSYLASFSSHDSMHSSVDF